MKATLMIDPIATTVLVAGGVDRTAEDVMSTGRTLVSRCAVISASPLRFQLSGSIRPMSRKATVRGSSNTRRFPGDRVFDVLVVAISASCDSEP